ncbi:MAG: hypothetical protein BGO49_22025 [Planctomycetales bacterium 71-10]|nr:MAG: hypothetical protein BGO49_22025 [Planctomycetales bacterium 71-10]
MPDPLRDIDAILSERLGLDRASIGPGMVPRAARARMRAVGLVEPSAYAELVASCPAELQELVDEVTVPESWFFRDGLPFAFLQGLAREGWTARPAREPLRILSLPCAGGEEPYSIAVTLDEAGLAPSRYRIDAVDVGARRLDYARRGVYSRNALRGVGADRVARWFRERDDGFEIDLAIRARVHFRVGNVLDPALLADAPRYDVVFCRNLLIYLSRDARARAEANLDRLLAPDGVLVVGHADTLGASEAGRAFVAASGRGTFAYRRRKPGEVAPAPKPAEAALPAPPPRPRPLSLAPPAPTAPTPPPSPPTASPPEDPRPLLEQATEHANAGRFGQALACCEREVRRAGPSAAAFALMGGIHQAAGRRSEAEGCFHKAIYLDPAHDEALLALALLAEGRGDRDAAAGFRRRAERALRNRAGAADKTMNPPTGGPTP